MKRDLALLQAAFARFCDLRDQYWEQVELPSFDYERYKFGVRSMMDPWLFFYARHSEGFARQIVNDIHRLRCFLDDLRCWRRVLVAYNKSERFLLICEFLEERTVLAITRPAAIRNRFVYAATKLGQVLAKVSRAEDLPEEQAINEKEMKRWVGSWADFPSFAKGLGELDGQAYRQATANFRNLDAHRFPPLIEFGIAPAAGVFGQDGRVCLSAGYQNPMKLEEIERFLTDEYRVMARVMDLFWSMVARQIEPSLAQSRVDK